MAVIDNRPPMVFISYAWEDEEHKAWVKSFADSLLKDGINAILDQYDLTLGDRLPQFMEQQIANADYVLIICTPTYREKSNARKGGVGYEGHIISGELLTTNNERKFIPIIRKGTPSEAIPRCLEGKLGVVLTGDSNYEDNYNDLLTTLLGKKRKPAIGTGSNRSSLPYSPDQLSQALEQEEPVHILGIITDEVTIPRLDGTRESALYRIPFLLSKEPSQRWKDLFVQVWDRNVFSNMHRPGIASISGSKIILNGTTVEEVRDYHRNTLKYCVEAANHLEAQFIAEEQRRQKQRELQEQEFRNNISSIARDIEF